MSLVLQASSNLVIEANDISFYASLDATDNADLGLDEALDDYYSVEV